MALTEQQRRQILDTLKNTALVHGAVTYPAECRAFLTLCRTETVAMPPVDGHAYTVYVCTAKNRTPRCPVHINIHGGGFIGPHAENDAMYSAWLADAIGGIVVDVDYTTSAAAPWPVAFDQCYETGRWAAAHMAAWDADPARLSMGGYSAGGVLTAGAALKAAQTGDFSLCLEVLGYAPLDNATHPLYKQLGYRRMMAWQRERAFADLYFDGETAARAADPYASPACAPDAMLARLPRTMICTAAGCNFRFEDEEYARRLIAQGVEVSVERFAGTNHGFIPHFMPGWRPAAEWIAQAIRSAGVPDAV